jgi:hypothetical protein
VTNIGQKLRGVGGAPAPTPGGGPAPAAPVINGDNGLGHGAAQPGDLTGLVYFIPENSQKLVDVTGQQPAATLYASQLNVAPRSWTDGFPGVSTRAEWFEIKYTGNFSAGSAGDYNFRLVSDDGAVVYVDDQKVLDNDGIHSPTEQKAIWRLTQGSHKIRVDYFQGPRDTIALQLWVTPPGGTEAFLQSSQ